MYLRLILVADFTGVMMLEMETFSQGAYLLPLLLCPNTVLLT